jgi:hypothetical protein
MMFSVTQNVFFRVPVDLTVFNKGRKPSEGQMNNKLQRHNEGEKECKM